MFARGFDEVKQWELDSRIARCGCYFRQVKAMRK